ncbi:MAG: hypothetical protein NTX65_05040 [Ignavibacteriales bacterium]|nr:hypothetical protein [Ignavibacteriales bacterium]
MNNSQPIGKIFTKEEANNLFGNVIDSVSIKQGEITSVLNQIQSYIMFQVSNGELVILGEGRKLLYPIVKNVGPDEVFALFSKSKVVELLSSGTGETISIEKRQNHLTVTFGLLTLEEAVWCPPFCPY